MDMFWLLDNLIANQVEKAVRRVKHSTIEEQALGITDIE